MRMFYLCVTAICSFILFSFSRPVYGQAEQIRITTYYPSPSGSYKNLHLIPSDEPASATKGTLYFDQTKNKVFVYNGLAWDEMGGTGGIPLAYSLHTVEDCQNAGGTVADTETGIKQCRFSGSSCPSGWTRYKSYFSSKAQTLSFYTSTRFKNGCDGTSLCWVSGGGKDPGCNASVYFPDMPFGNNNPCKCSSCSCLGCGTCNGKVCLTVFTSVGCY